MRTICPMCKRPVVAVLIRRQWLTPPHNNARGKYCRGSECKAANMLRRTIRARRAGVVA